MATQTPPATAAKLSVAGSLECQSMSDLLSLTLTVAPSSPTGFSLPRKPTAPRIKLNNANSTCNKPSRIASCVGLRHKHSSQVSCLVDGYVRPEDSLAKPPCCKKGSSKAVSEPAASSCMH